MLLRLTMLPRPPGGHPGASAPTRKNGARTLLANILSNAATSILAGGAEQGDAALLIRCRRRRHRCEALDVGGVAEVGSDEVALPPAAVISSTVSAPRAASRP